jgi:hypothetical protein
MSRLFGYATRELHVEEVSVEELCKELCQENRAITLMTIEN